MLQEIHIKSRETCRKWKCNTDQLLQPSQILLSEGCGVALHADLQGINQAAWVAVDGTTLEAEQPWVQGLKPFTPTTSYALSPGSLTHVKKFTHLCVHVGEVQELVSTFRCRRQSDGEVQEADGEITCRNLSYQNIFYHFFFQTDGRRWFIVRVVEIYHTLTVKLNSGPMSSRVLTAVMTGVAASATKKLMFDSLWIRKQGRTKVSCES